MSDDPLGLIGQVLVGRYRVQDYLGGGGFGYVYLAYDHNLKDEVALKFPRDYSFNDATVGEARTLHRLQKKSTSGHIVRFYGLEDINGRQVLVTEYCRGGGLDGRIKRSGRRSTCTPQPSLFVCRLLVQVCRALEEAHAINCIHRDIKPENIFLSEKPPCEGEAKLGDFGIAKIIESAGCGTIIGTPWYIAPEVYGGKESDSRLDIYSLGVTMYQLLAGDIPHDSRLAHGPFVEAVIRGKTKPISEYPNVDSRLGEIAMKSISVKPESRYQSASEMKAALEGICVDLSVESLLERAKQGTRPDVAEAEAKAGLAELVKQFPKSKRVYIELANLLRRMGSAAEAADVYQDALSHMVHDPELLYLLAHNYAAMGKYYLAIGFMEQALQSGGGTLDAKEIGCGKKVLVAWKKSAAKTKA